MQELQISVNEFQLPAIQWNREELKAQLEELQKGYADAIIQNDDDYKAAKKDRAALNKALKYISDQRIKVKKAVMAPYETFEAEVKETQKDLEELQQKVAGTIKDYEEEQDNKRRAWITGIFEEAKAERELGWLYLDRIFDKGWMKKTAKDEDVEKAIRAMVETIYNNVCWIRDAEADPTIKAAAMKQYEDTLEFGGVVRMVAELKRRAEEEKERQRRREEEQKRAEEETKTSRQEDLETLRKRFDNPETAPDIPDGTEEPPVPDDVPEAEIPAEEPRYFSAFCVRGTADQIMKLRETAQSIGLSIIPLKATDSEIGRVYIEQR